MQTKKDMNELEQQFDRMKSQGDLESETLPECYLDKKATKIGECYEIIHLICKHLPKLLIVRLVNKEWCKIASKILQERPNIWIRLNKQGSSNDELKSWSNMNLASRNNSKLTALDQLLKANTNFPCQNYFISVGFQGHSGTPSTFIVKWIDRIRSLHFDVEQMPFVMLFGNFMAKTGFVALQNVRNLQIEHGPYDWGLPRGVVSSNAPRINRLRKLILPGNLVCDRTSWREVLTEAVNLERIENCTLPFLPEIINQNKTNLVKSIYLNFDLKPNPAIGLTLQENVNVFVQAVAQGLKLEDILAFNIEVFISPHSRAYHTPHQVETLPPQATLTKWYQNVVQAFNRLLKNSQETLLSVQNISCLGYPSKDSTNGGCLTRIDIPRMTKMREIDWLKLHEKSTMKMDLLLPLENDGFSARKCFPNVNVILCDPSKEYWNSLSLKSSSNIEQLTSKLSMPSASILYWFCSSLDSNGHNFINRNRDCNLIQHLLHPIFPNLTTLHLQSLMLGQMPTVLTKIFQFYSNTLQELLLSNRSVEVAKESKSEMSLLDVPITGFPQSFLRILRESFKNIHVKTVHLLQTRPSIHSMKCLQKLSFRVSDPEHFHGGNIPLISDLSQLYGFEFLPQLKSVRVDNKYYDDDADDEQQQEFEDAGEGYYQKYRYYQQTKEQNVNQQSESLESQQMEEQQTKVELLFLKEKTEQKLKHLKRNSEIFMELESILVDVERLVSNM